VIGVLRRATDCQPSSNWRSGSASTARPFAVRRRRCRTLAWSGSSRAAAPLFKKISLTILDSRTRFSEIVKRQAKTPSVALLRSATIPADRDVGGSGGGVGRAGGLDRDYRPGG
jgi:hypothetical protein